VWGAKHLSGDIALVHTECGSRMNVIYHCPACDTSVKGAGVRLENQDDPLQEH
jgi:hypothetical protein